jgi:hypothetical protein
MTKSKAGRTITLIIDSKFKKLDKTHFNSFKALNKTLTTLSGYTVELIWCVYHQSELEFSHGTILDVPENVKLHLVIRNCGTTDLNLSKLRFERKDNQSIN